MTNLMTINNPVYESPVFLANITATERIAANQGGTWSGKTFSIIQAIFYLTISTKYQDDEGRLEPIISTIVGQDVPNLKRGAIEDFSNVCDIIVKSFPENCRHFFDYTYNKTDKVAKFNLNGSKIEFTSFKDWQDAKAGKRHFLFLNEANGIAWKIAEQLMFRVKIRTFIDYNPDAPFWVHHKLMGKGHVKMIYSNLTHNKFVPTQLKRELIEKGRKNPEFKKVYLLGKTGSTEGIVFPNVVWVQKMPERYKKEGYGMDLGYNDPTTLVRSVESEGNLYLELLIYESQMTASKIVNRIDKLGINKRQKILVDSQGKMTIQEMRGLGYVGMLGCKKGKGSIVAGIKHINSYGTIYIVDNIHFRAEQLGYKWSEDKKTGTLEDEPEDSYNHCWDATRYSREPFMRRQRKGTTIA